MVIDGGCPRARWTGHPTGHRRPGDRRRERARRAPGRDRDRGPARGAPVADGACSRARERCGWPASRRSLKRRAQPELRHPSCWAIGRLSRSLDGRAPRGRGCRPATVRHVERYEIAIAAERADTRVEALRGLVELGILQPDADGRFSSGDIRRVGVIHSLVAASIPLDLLASALRSGELSFDFIDDPTYSLFASYSDETFEELSARTGVPLHLLVAMREATGSGVPDPASRVREDEMAAIFPAIEFQLAQGFRAITVERNL